MINGVFLRSGDKRASTSKTGKAEETLASSSSASEKSEKKDIRSDSVSESDKESKDKDSKSVKRRKGSSRTPTPVQSEVSVVVSAGAAADVIVPTTSAQLLTQTDKKNCASAIENTADKLKKVLIFHCSFYPSNNATLTDKMCAFLCSEFDKMLKCISVDSFFR